VASQWFLKARNRGDVVRTVDDRVGRLEDLDAQQVLVAEARNRHGRADLRRPEHGELELELLLERDRTLAVALELDPAQELALLEFSSIRTAPSGTFACEPGATNANLPYGCPG